jgi:hypothetical protein
MNILKQSTRNEGFVLPSVLVIMSAGVLIALTVLQLVTTQIQQSYMMAYRQMAEVAAKSAIDTGKARFDQAAVPSDFNGVPETTITTNSSYRITMEMVVTATPYADGQDKRVDGIGRVYFPASATTPIQTKTIRGQIVRTIVLQRNPADYSPLAWFDAGCMKANYATSTDPNDDFCKNNDTVLKSSSGTATANATSTIEVRRDNGQQTPPSGSSSAWSSPDLEMSNFGEFGWFVDQYVGINFNFAGSLPAGATITSARITFQASENSWFSTSLRFKGIKQTNYPNFTSSNTQSLATATATSAVVNWNNMPRWNVNSDYTSPDMSPILNEIVSQAGWDNTKNVGFRIEQTAGLGHRTAKKASAGPRLIVNYTLPSSAPAIAGDNVLQWVDRTGKGFDLMAQASQAPVYSTINTNVANAAATPPNGKPAVQFQANGDIMAINFPAEANRHSESFTTIAYMQPTYSSNNGGSFIAFKGTGTGDRLIQPFYKQSESPNDEMCIGRNRFGAFCNAGRFGSSTTHNGRWVIWSSRTPQPKRPANLNRNGFHMYSTVFVQPGTMEYPFGSPSRLTVGGSPLTTDTPETTMSVAELIMYDRDLSCQQIVTIEKYIAAKWGTDKSILSATGQQYIESPCPTDDVPAY